MGTYEDYSGNMRGNVGFIETMSQAVLDHYNRQINENYETGMNRYYQNEVNNYSDYIQKDKIDIYTKALNEPGKTDEERANLQDTLNHYKDMQDLNEEAKRLRNEEIAKVNQKQANGEYSNIDQYRADMKKAENSQRVCLAFDTMAELSHFTSDMEMQGVSGVAITEKVNGQFVYITSMPFMDYITEYSDRQGIELKDYKPYEVENASMNKAVYQWGEGIADPLMQSVYASEAGHTQQQIHNAVEFVGQLTGEKLDETWAVRTGAYRGIENDMNLINHTYADIESGKLTEQQAFDGIKGDYNCREKISLSVGRDNYGNINQHKNYSMMTSTREMLEKINELYGNNRITPDPNQNTDTPGSNTPGGGDGGDEDPIGGGHRRDEDNENNTGGDNGHHDNQGEGQSPADSGKTPIPGQKDGQQQGDGKGKSVQTAAVVVGAAGNVVPKGNLIDRIKSLKQGKNPQSTDSGSSYDSGNGGDRGNSAQIYSTAEVPMELQVMVGDIVVRAKDENTFIERYREAVWETTGKYPTRHQVTDVLNGAVTNTAKMQVAMEVKEPDDDKESDDKVRHKAGGKRGDISKAQEKFLAADKGKNALAAGMMGGAALGYNRLDFDPIKVKRDILKKYEQFIPLDRHGNIAIDKLNLMSETDLKIIGMTKEERDFLIRTSTHTSFHLSPAVGLLGKMILKDPESDLGRTVRDFKNLSTRAKQAKQVILTAKKMAETPVRLHQANKIKRKVENDPLNTNLTDPKKLKDFNRREPKKKEEYKPKWTQEHRRKRLEKRERRAKEGGFIKRNARKLNNKIKNKVKNTKIAKKISNNKVVKKISSGTNKIKAFKNEVNKIKSDALKKVRDKFAKFGDAFNSIKKTLIKYAAAGVLAMILVIVVLNIAMAVSSFILSLLPDTKLENKVMYRLYKNLQGKETEWVSMIESKDTRNSIFTNKEKLYYSNKYTSYNDYITKLQSSSHKSGETSEITIGADGKTYMNPFGFALSNVDAGAAKELTAFDGDYKFSITTAGDSDHTSNIKDILCMTDTLYMDFLDKDGDFLSGSLNDNVYWYNAKKGLNSIISGCKFIGASFKDAFSGGTEGYDEWEASAKDNNYISYNTLETYGENLFALSHQEVVNLTLDRYPVKSNEPNVKICPVIKNNGTCASYNNFRYFISGNNVLLGLADSNGKMHAVNVDCSDSACIQTSYSNNMTGWEKATGSCWTETEGTEEITSKEMTTDGKIYKTVLVSAKEYDPIINKVVNKGDRLNEYAVTAEYEKELKPAGNTKEYFIYMTDLDGNKQKYSITKAANSYEINLGVSFNESSTESTTYNYNNTTKCFTKTVKKVTNGKETVTIGDFKYPCGTLETKIQKTTRQWNCAGHTGTYCKGHISVDYEGVVYSFSQAQVDAMGENGNGDISSLTKLKGVNYLTLRTATASGAENVPTTAGLNLWTTSGGLNWEDGNFLHETFNKNEQRDYVITLKDAKDIFDIDLSIKYGKKLFPYDYIANNFILGTIGGAEDSSAWKNFKSWDEDNMSFALLKFSQDWTEVYEFDIPTETGTHINPIDIKNIISGVKGCYSGLSSDREYAVELALKSVGNGGYSMKHHDHAYLYREHDGVPCKLTDCSGFVSYIFQKTRDKEFQDIIANRRRNPIDVNIPANTVLATTGLSDGCPIFNGNWNSVTPGDAIIYHNGKSASEGGIAHALIYIGKTNTSITLSDGRTIPAGTPITVDCSTRNGGGIFLQWGFSAPSGTKTYIRRLVK